MDRLTEIEQHMARVMSVAVMSEAEYHEYKEDTWAALQWAVAEVKRLREKLDVVIRATGVTVDWTKPGGRLIIGKP